VSKVANWGNWVMAAVMGYVSLYLLGVDVLRGEGLIGILVDCAFGFALVWGIVKWAKWAYVFLVIANGLGLLLLVYGHYKFHFAELSPSRMGVAIAGGLAMLTWLFLPSVRRKYWDKERVA
jgi:hypothetical protein